MVSQGQASDKFFPYNKSRKMKNFLILKRIMANYGWKRSFLLFLDAVATVDVLTASNNDVNFVETQTVHFS